jgi:hypothetical protein
MAIFSGVLSRIYSQADSLGYAPREDLTGKLSGEQIHTTTLTSRLLGEYSRTGSHEQDQRQTHR